MTDCALVAPQTHLSTTTDTRTDTRTTSPTTAPSRRTRQDLPPGVPRWARLFGVTVVPLRQEDPRAGHAWVVSAGAGTTHAAALFHDDPTNDR
jgi:hypothetical protein